MKVAEKNKGIYDGLVCMLSGIEISGIQWMEDPSTTAPKHRACAPIA